MIREKIDKLAKMRRKTQFKKPSLWINTFC
jgi:hypothetical protein